MRIVHLDFTDSSSLFDLALYLDKWDATPPGQETGR
jgi:hypothetical protein